MKKFCLLIAVCILAIVSVDVAWGQHTMSNMGWNTYPRPFNEIQQQTNRTQAAASTGYYFMDNRVILGADKKWQPGPLPNGATSGLLPLTWEPHLWYRIYSGPRQVPRAEVESGYDHVNHLILPPVVGGVPTVPREGYRYFRNPAQHNRYLNRLDTDPGIDTVRHAIAGPIPIGFPFFMNGLRYDSFYVSPRGIIALSNRRYFYNSYGDRVIPPGKTDCYDEMSADWGFLNGVPNNTAPNQGRRRISPGSPASLNDPTPDNYGFRNIACGGTPLESLAGIRQFVVNGDADVPTNNGSMQVRLSNNNVAGAAYIAPLEGPFYLPQWNEKTNLVHDWGQVWYKRSMYNDRLIIYFRNLQMDSGQYLRPNNQVAYIVGTGRPYDPIANIGDANVLSASCQVELNRLDSSITFRYNEFNGYIARASGGSLNSQEMFQPFSSKAIGGFARHKGYSQKDPNTWTRPETEPWAGQYMQVTQLFHGLFGVSGTNGVITASIPPNPIRINNTVLYPNYQVKFKQWRNALRLTDIQYYVRAKHPDSTNFNVVVRTDDVTNTYDPFELLAGHEQLGELQPVALIQNLTNDIQGPTGVNFVPQDFQFQARLLIRNKVTDSYVYNRSAKVSEFCLNLTSGTSNIDCGADPFASVRYATVTRPQTEYIATEVFPLPSHLNGIPPYGFAFVKFPRYRPNEFIQEQIGLMEVLAVTEPIDPITGFNFGDNWPFDDSNSIDLWVINRLREFKCYSDFHNVPGAGLVPNIHKWVYAKFGPVQPSVTVITANENTSEHPLPPTGISRAINTNNPAALRSPMMRMTWQGPVGSKITSFPIDLRNRNGSVMTLGVQRGTADMNTDRGFNDGLLVGPETRVVFNRGFDNHITTRDSNYLSGKIDMSNTANTLTAASTDPDFDYLAVEYLRPSDNGVRHITMTGSDNNANNNYTAQYHAAPPSMTPAQSLNNRWRFHPYWRNGAYQSSTVLPGATGTPPALQNTPALAIFGGGGHFVGWSFADGKTYWPANWNGGQWANNDKYGGGGIVLYNPRTDTYTNALQPLTNQVPVLLPVAGLMYNPYDVGFDFEFYRYSVPIPDFFMDNNPAIGPDGGKNFRFRIRHMETNLGAQDGDQQNVISNPRDDDDIFLVDNVAVMFPDVNTDIEASVVKVIWPYRVVPASQAIDMDIITRISNIGTSSAIPFVIKVRAFRGDLDSYDADRPIYCRTTTVPELASGQSREIAFQNFSPRNFVSNVDPNTGLGTGIFTLQLIVDYPNKDLDSLNDTTYSTFTLRFGDEYSYTFGSSIAEVGTTAGVQGKGLNLLGTSFSGYNTDRGNDPQLMSTTRYAGAEPRARYFQPGAALPWVEWVAGGAFERPGYPSSHFVSGQIAMKFELTAADTLKGVRVAFAAANQAFDDISFNVYGNFTTSDGVDVPQVNNLPGVQLLYARRMLSKTANGVESTVPTPLGEFVLYEFPTPIRLERGKYWISIDQRGETGLELAAVGEAMGMRTMLVHSLQTRNAGGTLGDIGVLGGSGIQIMVDRRFRVPANRHIEGRPSNTTNRVYINNNVFAYRNVLNGGNSWNPFMPTSGHVAYAHLDHYGRLANGFNTFTRGTWAPLMKPYFGPKTVAFDNNIYPCPDDAYISIEVVNFDGYVRNNAIDLVWETVSEVNNRYFILERANVDDGIWKEIAQVEGAGNSNFPNNYKFVDGDVVSGNTYQYRLYNMDFDGTISCQDNNIVTVEYVVNTRVELKQNNPNPFGSETHISFVVPEAQTVTLEIIDIFGRTVKTLVNNEVLRGTHSYTWNGTDNNNMRVADGNYLYRLTTGSGEVLTMKMSYIKSY